MGQKDKLIKRLKTHPKDFTFDDTAQTASSQRAFRVSG